MNIYIICAGKIREKWLKDGVQEYKKRLSTYCKLEIIEVADASEQGDITQAKLQESERLWKQAKENAFKIALDLHGEALSSEELATKLEPWFIAGGSNICIFIAGSYGFSENFLAKVDYRFSLGRLTYTHQMCRLILLEQIYRAFKIQRGERYHK